LSFFRLFAASCAALDLLASIYFFSAHGFTAFVNLHIALAGSLAILFAAYIGYKKTIEKRVETAQSLQEGEEEDEEEEESEPVASKMSILKDSYQGFLFPLRLAAYAVFAFSFIYLSSSELLIIAPFLAGLGVVPLAVLLTMGIQKLTSKQEEVTNQEL